MQNHVASPLMLITNPYTKVCGSYVRLCIEKEITRFKKEWRELPSTVNDVLDHFLHVS